MPLIYSLEPFSTYDVIRLQEAQEELLGIWWKHPVFSLRQVRLLLASKFYCSRQYGTVKHTLNHCFKMLLIFSCEHIQISASPKQIKENAIALLMVLTNVILTDQSVRIRLCLILSYCAAHLTPDGLIRRADQTDCPQLHSVAVTKPYTEKVCAC